MIRLTRRWGRGPVTAAAALALATTVAGTALWRALAVEPPPAQAAPPALPDIAPVTPPDAPSLDSALAAVDVDPFHPERRRPAQRFRLPGESRAGELATTAEAPRATGPVELVGTVVRPSGGGFAVCRAGGDHARVIRVGETIGGLVLRSVEAGRALFANADGSTLELEVPEPGT